MSMFNKKLVEGLFGRGYICPKCNSDMEFEDEYKTMLVCPRCGESMDLDEYGTEDEILYSVTEDFLDTDEEEEDEWYDEICGELDD